MMEWIDVVELILAIFFLTCPIWVTWLAGRTLR